MERVWSKRGEGRTLRAYQLAEDYTYCEQLAKAHYENFTVGSRLLPKEERKHVWAIYAFCRFTDDLGDEAQEDRLAKLDWWEGELWKCYNSAPEEDSLHLHHVIMVALADTIQEFSILPEPFLKLIEANRMDQRIKRYRTYKDLLYYCDHSANPVGRLFLHLFGYHDPERQRLADYTCTALQLTNFWQDIAADLEKDRIYIPQEDLEQFGYPEAGLREHVINDNFIELLRFELERTQQLFHRGLRLIELVDRRIRVDLKLFFYGGMAILDKIEKHGYDIFRHRPTLPKWEKGLILIRSLARCQR